MTTMPESNEIERREIPLLVKIKRAVFAPRTYRMLLAFIIFIAIWHILTAYDVSRFENIPTPLKVAVEFYHELTTPDSERGYPIIYLHLAYSTYRVWVAFGMATLLGVPLGIMMGWNKIFKDFTFPLVETLRPIPPIAWIPLAVLIFPAQEPSIIYIVWLSAFFATVLNAMLGVESIDKSYFRAAKCLGASNRDIFRHVVFPGSLPFVFTGLQLGMGAAWFSLVGGEMIAGRFGLGYLTFEAFTLVQYSLTIIAMLGVGLVGYASSAVVRSIGTKLMVWRAVY